MDIRTALVVLRKDLRRFWWETAVTLIPLGLVSSLDLRRYECVPGPTEAMLQLLVPAAWAYLIAIVMQEDGMAGARQFWMVRPISPGTLAVAKSMFIVISIHLPCFVADCIIVAGHGHSLAGALPAIVWKQAILAALVTVPAAALASVTESLAQFVPAAIAAAVITYFFAIAKLRDSGPWQIPGSDKRLTGVVMLLAGAAVVLVAQFGRRRTAQARWLGAVVLLGGGVFFVNLSDYSETSVVCDPVSSPLRIERTGAVVSGEEIPVSGIGPPLTPRFWAPTKDTGLPWAIRIPVVLRGLPKSLEVSFEQKELQATTKSGVKFLLPRAGEPNSAGEGELFTGYLSTNGGVDPVQGMYVTRRIYNLLAAGPFTLRGRVVASIWEFERKHVPQGTGLTNIPDVGRCMTDQLGSPGFTVYCESPQQFPAGKVVLTDGSREWAGYLDDSMRAVGTPWRTWLSPLNRRETSFNFEAGPGRQGRPPGTGATRLSIETSRRTACMNTSYELHDVRIGGAIE